MSDDQHAQTTDQRTGRAACSVCYRRTVVAEADGATWEHLAREPWPCQVMRLRASVSHLTELLTGYGDDDYAALPAPAAARCCAGCGRADGPRVGEEGVCVDCSH